MTPAEKKHVEEMRHLVESEDGCVHMAQSYIPVINRRLHRNIVIRYEILLGVFGYNFNAPPKKHYTPLDQMMRDLKEANAALPTLNPTQGVASFMTIVEYETARLLRSLHKELQDYGIPENQIHTVVSHVQMGLDPVRVVNEPSGGFRVEATHTKEIFRQASTKEPS